MPHSTPTKAAAQPLTPNAPDLSQAQSVTTTPPLSNNAALIKRLPTTKGSYRENAALGKKSWFGTGGAADVLYKPADSDDLAAFLKACPADIPLTVLGVCSNVIIRDGGIEGVVIKLGREFAHINIDADAQIIEVGAAALDLNVARETARAGCAGLEFLSGIPGSIGGALRMNGGAYGNETANMLIDADMLDRNGKHHKLTATDMNMAYRYNDAPADGIFTAARFKTTADDPALILARIDDIRTKREDTQPIREKTGGSTFANPSASDIEAAGLPAGTKTWQLVDMVGGRGLMMGGAQISAKHCNFMINTGTATAQDLEDLGEEIRRRVYDETGITLRWEIKRIGRSTNNSRTAKTAAKK